MSKNQFFKKLLLFFVIVLCSTLVTAQQGGTIKGKVIDKNTRKGVPFVNIILVDSNKGAVSDEKGFFEIKNTPLGYRRLEASFVGYTTVVSPEYLITKNNVPYVVLEISEDSSQLEEVVVSTKLFKTSITNPISAQSIGIEGIEKNPGGNRDAIKVLESFPGVASNPGFRNDIVIRGGATSESKFYLDGVEVPVINHFQTQGAAGGSVGLINTDLIRSVDFITSGFKANKGNALSSIIEFTSKSGNRDRIKTRATLGTSDAGITIDGPMGKETTYMLSLRQSYLQFLFKAIKLPFLPTYNDFQFNVKSDITDKDRLIILGIGALDRFKLNESVNDGVEDKDIIKRNNYILSNIPVQNQWNYTLGANYQHFGETMKHQLIVSHSIWNNTATKYKDNTNKKEDLLTEYESREIENNIRYENDMERGGYKLNLGIGLKNSIYTNSTFRKIALPDMLYTLDFSSRLSLLNYAVWGQVSKEYFKKRLSLSLGTRLEGLNYNSHMKNIFNQFSPRLSARYYLAEKWSLNATAGIYYQMPSYTTLGFKDRSLELVNKKGLTYIRANHLVGGIEYRPNSGMKLSVESFYKGYSNYPFSVENKISLANLGSDYGVVGNEEVTSTSEGRAYGLEFLWQKKSYTGLYGILSYTLVFSEFKDRYGKYVPSSWDNRHLLTFTGGIHLKKNWEIGTKFRFVGGKPFTPYDKVASADIERYNIRNSGILDYTRLNTLRFKNYSQLDIRVDKTWFLKKWSINLYLDIKNIYASSNPSQPYLIPQIDENGEKIINPDNNSQYLLEEIDNSIGRVLPSIGFVIDF